MSQTVFTIEHILIGGVRVVVIHMGTNSVDYRVWGQGGGGGTVGATVRSYQGGGVFPVQGHSFF